MRHDIQYMLLVPRKIRKLPQGELFVKQLALVV